MGCETDYQEDKFDRNHSANRVLREKEFDRMEKKAWDLMSRLSNYDEVVEELMKDPEREELFGKDDPFTRGEVYEYFEFLWEDHLRDLADEAKRGNG